jgi:hypothetical protein
MKESYDEGLASHIGPESCGVVRENAVEALTGVRAGWVLNPESSRTGVPTRILWRGRPYRTRSQPRDLGWTPRDPRPHARTDTSCGEKPSPRRPGLRTGSREIPGLVMSRSMVRAENPKGARRR